MVKSILANLLTGFAALGVVMTGFMTGLLSENLRVQAILVGALFLLAGVIRGSAPPSNRWLKGLTVNLGAAIPICAMALTGVAFTSRPHLAAFLVTSLLGAIAGAYVRTFWGTAHRRISVTVAASWAVTVVVIAQLLIPAMLGWLWTRRVNSVAPPFSFSDADGRRITNQSVHGRIAVLAFWATWCTPCRYELPRLDALYRRYSDNPRVAFLAVDAEGDHASSSPVKAKALFTKMHLFLPLVISDRDVSRRLGITGLPTLLIVDGEGNLRLVHSGYDEAEDLEGIVNRQIADLLKAMPNGR